METRRALLTLAMMLLFCATATAQSISGSYASFTDRSQTVVASSGSVLPGTCQGSCPADNGDRLWSDGNDGWDSPCQPCLSITAEALFLQLNRAGNQTLVINNVTDDPVLTSDALKHNMVGGPRLGLRRTLCSGSTLEVSYFGLHEWESIAAVIGASNLSLPAPLGPATDDFSAAGIMTASLTSRIHNAEFNLIRPTTCPGLAILGGFRYFNLDEGFNLNSEDLLDGTSDYHISTDNNLYGAQIGASLKHEWSHVELEFIGKVGLFGAESRQRTFLADNDNTTILRDTSVRGGQEAFVGELGFNGTLHLTQSLYCRAGYNLIWVDGVARATDQLDFTTSALSSTTLSSGSAFLHGVNVGLEARW